MKKTIKKWLCEHKEDPIIRREVTKVDFGDPDDKKILTLKLWHKCEDCGRIRIWKSENNIPTP